MARTDPQNSRILYEDFCLYCLNDTLEIADSILEAEISKCKEKKGIIFIMDMTKSTEFILSTEDVSWMLSTNLTMLMSILISFGSRIILDNPECKYWISEGDKFILFIPISDSESGSNILKMLISISKSIQNIKKNTKIGFKAGVHFGWLLLVSDNLYSNSDIIIATRTMEFSKRNDVIIVTEDVLKKIHDRGTNEEKIDQYIKPPCILLEGKPNKWIQPLHSFISINENDIEVFEIG